MLASNYETYFISADGVIIQTTVTDNTDSYIFTALKGIFRNYLQSPSFLTHFLTFFLKTLLLIRLLLQIAPR